MAPFETINFRRESILSIHRQVSKRVKAHACQIQVQRVGLRLHRALRCLGGDMKDGFGGLGRGMSSALVGSGYGWDGWFVCLGGGGFS